MVVMTAKFSKKKLLASLFALVILVMLIACVLKGQGREEAADGEAARREFLSSFGYEIKDGPAEQQSLRIPDTPSEVFERYNTLQKSQGYDLSSLAGQEVTRYVYELENDDDSGEQWYATILEHDGEVVGGDISQRGGKMHGFQRPEA